MYNNSNPATWVSHSSIRDFIKCPKMYYFHNVYKDPKTKNKITLISPAMAMGQVVHEVLESLSTIRVEERLNIPLLEKYEEAWQRIAGRKGGFDSIQEEADFKERGRKMLQRVIDNPGPLANKALTFKTEDKSFPLPRYNISVEDNIILCGKIDWLEYVPETDSVHIIDFKTGKHEEDPNSFQLAIYCLLVQNLQKRDIHRVSYWYLDKDNDTKEMQIPDLKDAEGQILALARKIKEARKNRLYDCPKNGCYACNPYTAIINGEAEFVGTTSYQDVYVM